MVQVAEYLSSKTKALSSNPNTSKKMKEKKREREKKDEK
jgi:hypothetical protein